MKTSIRSKPFVALPTNRRTKYLQNRAISQLGAEKITFPPKPDRQTDIHTYRETDERTFAFIE